MNRWFGAVGFQRQVETRPGVWKMLIEERKFFGDITNHKLTIASQSNSTNLNPEITNTISIVADEFALNHASDICYIEFYGAKRRVKDISVEPPRLVMSIGGVWKNAVGK